MHSGTLLFQPHLDLTNMAGLVRQLDFRVRFNVEYGSLNQSVPELLAVTVR